MKYTLLLFFILHAISSAAQIVIPSPQEIRSDGSTFCPGKTVTVSAPDTSTFYLTLLEKEVLPTAILHKSRFAAQADIRFTDDRTLLPEAYTLRVSPDGIEVRASGKEGFFYAVQTLRQLALDTGSGVAFPCTAITDRLRLSFRAGMLDSGRQYQRVATIKKFIDMLAMLKMNYFHWHLTDGLGWRIEIKRYPELTAKGAFVATGAEQQGFYTQDEIREIVRYAADRCITVIPEIDMPGHAEAALSAYPELSCFQDSVIVPETGFTSTIFCAGKLATIAFLKQVVDEVCGLFPSPYIHLGGDEAPKDKWNECPDCQQAIRDKQLSDSEDLQAWFTAEMAGYLKEKGRKAVFWGDVVRHGNYPLPDNVVIQWWNWRGAGDRALKEAQKRNLPVICNTNYYTYLNFPLHPWKGYEVNRTFDIRDVYLANPSYLPADTPCLLGMSCSLWCDYGVTENMLDGRLFPRILALAEQMWHPGELKHFDAFYNDVQQKKNWFEKQGFVYGPALKNENTNHPE
ncbi:MAG: beta-N-acetylhexosaminidase [Parabacteroides sp.]|nr:beta-N-acetylhexosaminidase [Parabacteroides sp.]